MVPTDNSKPSSHDGWPVLRFRPAIFPPTTPPDRPTADRWHDFQRQRLFIYLLLSLLFIALVYSSCGQTLAIEKRVSPPGWTISMAVRTNESWVVEYKTALKTNLAWVALNNQTARGGKWYWETGTNLNVRFFRARKL